MKTKKYIVEMSEKNLDKKIVEFEKRMKTAESEIIAYSIYWTMAKMKKAGLTLTVKGIVNYAMKHTMFYSPTYFSNDMKNEVAKEIKKGVADSIEIFLDCMEMDNGIKVKF